MIKPNYVKQAQLCVQASSSWHFNIQKSFSTLVNKNHYYKPPPQSYLYHLQLPAPALITLNPTETLTSAPTNAQSP